MPLSFAHAGYLAGLLTLAVPIYLHLYYRRVPVPRDFPSLRLIRMSVEALVRRMKLRNLILLVLRLLVLAFLVLGLARPFVGGGHGGGSGDPLAFVVVLDNSLSMGAAPQGISLFNTAKAKALEIVDRMGPDDKGAIALLNDPGGLVTPTLTWDREELKNIIRNVPLSMAGTNIYTALAPSWKLLQPVQAFRRTIYLVTDVTASAWKPFLDNHEMTFDPTLQIVLVPIGDRSIPNLAVTGLTLPNPLVMRGRTAVLHAEVANFATTPKATRLSLFLDGEKKNEIPLTLEPNSRRKVTFECAFPREGLIPIEVRLPADALPQDDVRHLAVRVLPPQRLLLVRPEADTQGRDSRDDLFLRSALNPLNRSQGSTFIVESRSTSEAATLDPAPYSAVFLVNQRRLPEPWLKQLAGYVMAGGNLVIVPGEGTDPEWWNTNLLDRLGGEYLLPARVFKRVGNAVSKAVAYQLTDLDTGHPALALFRQEGNGDPGRAHFYEFFQVRPNPTALVLARMSHGLPAIIEETRGQGKVLMLTFPTDNTWGNWPLKPTFLPFLHQAIIGMLSRQGLHGDQLAPGMTFSLVLREQGLKSVHLRTPDGRTQELPTRKEGEGLLHISVTQTDLTGFYQLTIKSADGERYRGFTINPPPDESDLTRFPPRQIPRVTLVESTPGSGASLGEKVDLARQGRDMSGLLLWLLLGLAVAESVLANRPAGGREGGLSSFDAITPKSAPTGKVAGR
jgi:hypothetical protein